MRAGKLSQRATFLDSTGRPVVWSELGSAWVAIEAHSKISASGLLGSAGKMRMRSSELAAAGRLLRIGSRWWRIDAVTENGRHRDLEIDVREIIGTPATYTPLSGDSYSVLAVARTDSEYFYQSDENRTRIELFEVQLVWPWGVRGDMITIGGVSYRVDARIAGEADGVIATLAVV